MYLFNALFAFTLSWAASEASMPPITDYLFVVGGYNNDGFLSSSEAVYLGQEHPAKVCEELPDFPVAVDYATGSVRNGKPVVCGGIGGVGETYSQCHEYHPSLGGWSAFVKMNATRWRAASVQLDETSFAITGGYSTSHLSSTEVFSPDPLPHFSFGVDLPVARDGHCVAKIDENRFILAGGYGGSDLSYRRDILIFDSSISTWSTVGLISQTDMTGQACGLTRARDGTMEFVMAGDFDDEVSRVEIFNIDRMELREGPALPRPLSEMAAVQLEETFLLVGGIDFYAGASNNIYAWDSEHVQGGWIELNAKLSVPRFAAVGVLVSPEVVSCV